MNTSGGIFSLLSIIIFTLSSFNVEARRSSRKAEDIAKKLYEKNPDSEQSKAELALKLEAILEKNPDFDPTSNRNFDPREAVNEIHKQFIAIESKGREAPAGFEIATQNVNALLQTRPENASVFISPARASSIVEVLSHKLGKGKLSESTKKHLTETIQRRSDTIGQSLLKLAQKVESARTEDVAVIVRFAENIKNIDPVLTSKDNPKVANVLLDLGNNLHDMPFWDAQPRTTVMSVLKTFNEKLGKRATKEDTEISLQIPGPPALNSPHSKVTTHLKVGGIISVETALMLAITKNMVRMEDISTYGLQTAIRMIKQRIRDLCKG